MKECTKCKVELEVGINISKSVFNNYDYTCRACRKVETTKWREDNKEYLQKYSEDYRDANRNKQRERDRLNYQQNKEEIKSRQREYYKTHPRPKKESIKKPREKKSSWNERNPGYYNQYHKSRKQIDSMYKLICNTRSLIGGSFKRACKGTYRKSIGTEEILGCTLPAFTEYLQQLFQENMSMDNYGEWELDHIIPISSAQTEEDIIRLNHYSNYQPLWKEDNLKKSNKIVGY